MNLLEKLYKISPVKIKGEFFFLLKFLGFDGGYYNKSDKRVLYPHIIYDESLTNNRKITVLSHEIGHALCDFKNCKCMKTNEKGELENIELAEYHAYKYSLKWLLQNKAIEPLKIAIDNISGMSTNSPYPNHMMAVKKIMKLKLWEKCSEFVEKNKP